MNASIKLPKRSIDISNSDKDDLSKDQSLCAEETNAYNNVKNSTVSNQKVKVKRRNRPRTKDILCQSKIDKECTSGTRKVGQTSCKQRIVKNESLGVTESTSNTKKMLIVIKYV